MPFMPRNRTQRSRRRRVVKRRISRRSRRPMTAGKVKRIIDAELKVRDLEVGPVAIPTLTGNMTHISNIPQGDSAIDRTGNWIKPTTWMATITIQGNAVALNTLIPNFRIGCFVWKENQELNAPNIGKIMENSSDPHQQYNIGNKGQFKILWSRTGILSNDPTNPQFLKVFRFYVRPSMKILYEDASFKNNQLFIFAYSDVASANNPPTFGFATRVRFTDS